MRRLLYALMLVWVLFGLLLAPAPLAVRRAAGAPQVAVSAPAALPAGGASPAGPTLVEADDRHIVLEWSAPAYQVVTATMDGRAVQRIVMAGCAAAGAPGEPELPLCSTVLGVPPGAALTLRIVEDQSLSLGAGFRLPPLPDLAVEPDLLAELAGAPRVPEERRVAGPAYERDDPFPARPAALGEAAFLRHQRLVAVTLAPFQYRPRSGELLYHPRVRLEITLGEAREPMGFVAEPAAFERLLAGQLLNYQQARGWRRTTAQPLDLPPVPPDPGWRIPIAQEGIYKLTYTRLQAAGLPLDTLDPRTLRLLRYGQEVAIRVVGEDDGHFDPADYLFFYGRPLAGSRYTDAEVYWLTYGGAAGRRMAARDGTPGGTAPVPTSFAIAEHLEQNLAYRSQSPWRADHDHWYWNYTYPEANLRSQSYPFPAHALAPEMYTATLRLYLYSLTSDPDISPDHHIRVLINDVQMGEFWWDGQVELTPTMPFSAALLQPGGNTVRVENPGDTGAFAEAIFYDRLDLEQRRLFAAEADTLAWDGATGAWEYHLDNFTEAAIHLLDVRDLDGPVEILSATLVPAGPTYSLHFADQVTATTAYRAAAAGQVREPASIAPAAPADLRDPANGADYIVITPGDFYTPAQALAALRTGQGLRAMVVGVQDVYDLFAYGRPVPEAVRDFLAYAYAYWTAPAPAYAVLLGDGHYDPKNYLGYGTGEYILPYLAWVDPWLGQTAADNRYACVSGADALPDMHLGRLPANTPAQAQVMVDKVIAYESSPPPGDWRQQALFIADNADEAGDFAALSDALIADTFPGPYAAQRVYLGVTHPYENPSVAAHDALVAGVNAGRLLVNYVGHGGPGLWASERLLNITQVGQLANAPYYPVVAAMTCYEGYYIQPQADWRLYSQAETYLRAAGKGWVASWSPTGLGVATGHDSLDRGFFQAVFLDDERQLGPATLAGKLRLWATGYNLDLLDTYLLFGDPALEMPLLETDLSLDKAVAPAAPVQPGDAITFTLFLAAAGPATAHHVVLSDTLSPFLVDPTVQAAGLTLTPRPGTQYVWDVGDMAAGQSGTVTLSAHLAWQTPAGTYVNQARVATTAQETDPNNNADLVSFQVVPGPPYAVQVSADPPALPADGLALSDIRAHVVDTAGNAVADGTPVAFATSAGTFADGSTYYTTTTTEGGAAVFLRAASQVVTATVTVTSLQAGGQVQVPFLSTEPHSVVVTAWPTAIPVTGTAAITATVRDILGHPVQDGTGVSLTTTLGAIAPPWGATQDGLVTATLFGEGQAGLAAVVARSGDAAGAAQVRLGAGSDYTLTLAVTPAALPADGQSSAVLTATLVRADGRPITDTHWVTFSATLGSVTPAVRLAYSGTATATLTAGTRAGASLLIATAEHEAAWQIVRFLPGPAALLTLTASPASIPVGGATAVATAAVRDAHGNKVADGTLVTLTTSLGTISPTVAATQGGTARATVRSGTTAGSAVLTAHSGPAGGAAVVAFTPLAPFTVTLAASPTAVLADGQTPAALAAWVGDRYGNAVADGTTVELYTDLGTLWPPQAGTVGGWASAALTSTAVGTATVQCFVGAGGQAQAQTTVRFNAGPPAALLLTASPGRLYANGTSTATVTVYARDAWNHPVADGTPITLSASLGTIAPQAVTTSGGQAAAVLRAGRERGWAAVTARSGPAGGETRVEFFAYRVYLWLIMRHGESRR